MKLVKADNILIATKINIRNSNNFITFSDAEKMNLPVEAIMLKLCQSLNRANGNMNEPTEIADIGEFILAGFRGKIKFEEMIYIFQEIANGRFGKFFGKMTYQGIAEMINKYIEQRQKYNDDVEESRKLRELGDFNERSGEKNLGELMEGIEREKEKLGLAKCAK